MNKPLFNNLLILGVGLIGGSLALAARRAGTVGAITGWSRRQSTLDDALQLGVIDRAEPDLDAALQVADCVVVATPTQLTESLMGDVLERVDDSVVVTDVASVKGNIAEALRARFGTVPANAVLVHPVAGSEKSGVSAARADLFEKHFIVLVQESSGELTEAQVAIKALWEAVGARVHLMASQQHDRMLALTSHLPHLLAYALVEQLAEDPDANTIFQLVGGGFRDFTRIAGSDPLMWREIFLANKMQLRLAIEQFEEQIDRLKNLLDESEGEQLQSSFERAKQARNQYARLIDK